MDSEDESVDFQTEVDSDDDSIDFVSEVDNGSFIRRRGLSMRSNSSARSTPRAVPAVPTIVPPAITATETGPATPPPETAHDPRPHSSPLTKTSLDEHNEQTQPAPQKKTVVSNMLARRTQAHSRGRSPAVVPDANLLNDGGAHEDASLDYSAADGAPPAAAGGNGAAPAGEAEKLAQVLKAFEARPQSFEVPKEPRPAARPAASAPKDNGKAATSDAQRSGRASTTTSQPPSASFDDTQRPASVASTVRSSRQAETPAEQAALREVASWYTQFNEHRMAEINALQRQVVREQRELAEVRKHTAPAAAVKSVPRAASSGRPAATTIRGASNARPAAASTARTVSDCRAEKKAANKHHEKAAKASEDKARAVARRCGVMLPTHPLIADGKVKLPTRLFFASGVHVTAQQRTELQARIEEALRGGASQAEEHQSTAVLGSRRSRSASPVLENSADQPPSTRKSGGSRASRASHTARHEADNGRSAEWKPFLGALRDYARGAASTAPAPYVRDRMTERPKSRTEVLRSAFKTLDSHRTGILMRASLEAQLDALADAPRVKQGGHSGDMPLMLKFLHEMCIPLLLTSGFEELTFPTFSMLMLRVADRHALPADLEFPPVGASPLAGRGGHGPDMPDADRVADGLNWYLAELARPAMPPPRATRFATV